VEETKNDPAKWLLPGYQQVFSANGVQYIYDFDRCSISQVVRAREICAYANRAMSKPAKSLRDHDFAGMLETDLKAMGTLLLKQLDDGTIVPFDNARKASSEAEAFIAALPAHFYDELMKCRDNFFKRANIVNLASLLQLMPMVAAIRGESSSSAEAPPSSNGSTSSALSETSGSEAQAT